MQKGAESFGSFSFLLDLPGFAYYISFYVKFKLRIGLVMATQYNNPERRF